MGGVGEGLWHSFRTDGLCRQRLEIEQLLASSGLEYRYKTLGQEEWDTLLVVLGKPVETLTKPENRNGTDARYRERVAQPAAKPYDPRWD
jgi:hypothetical protein